MAKQRFTKSVSGSFNDQEHLDRYLNENKFPKIHQEFGTFIKMFASEPEGSLDLGTCTGLMSIYNVHNGRSFCVGVEGNTFDYNRCLPHPSVTYENFYVTRDTFPRLRELIRLHGVTLVTARRVFPEISMDNAEIIRELCELLWEEGVVKIVGQGRAVVKNPAALLWNADLEVACFGKRYVRTKSFNDIYLLERKDYEQL